MPAGPALTGPVRKALALLLHQPALAALAGSPANLADTGLKGVETLQAVLEFAQEHPHITGAGLLEHWRDTETGSYLMKLAQAELLTPDDGMESEFRAVVADLAGRRDEQRLAALVETSRLRPLGNEEKAELTRLITARRTGLGAPKL